ncbi:MAG: SEC-C domain-containing protein [Thermoanaerobaculia bacterium]
MTDAPAWQPKLEETNRRIIERLSRVETIWVLRHCAEYLRNFRNKGFSETPLHSPVRQIFHLLGLMLATPCEEPGDLTPGAWADLLYDLQIAFGQYSLMFFPEPSAYLNPPPNWWKVRDLAMPVYLEYFFTLPLMYEEQISDRIVRWFGPFDQYFADSIGLTTSDALKTMAWLPKKLEEQAGVVMKAKRKLIDAIEQRDRSAFDKAALAFEKDLDPLYTYSRAEMISELGQDLTDSFLRLLAVRRGEVQDYFYPTEENPALARPLIWLDEDRVGCADLGVLHHAILGVFERTIANSKHKARFLSHRSDDVVGKTREVFEDLLPSGARVWQEVEPADRSSEHDLLVEVGSTYLVVEVKSTPPKEPFRDPEKAYERLQRSFRSDRGIQSAYDQAERLRALLLKGEEVTFYNGGKVAGTLPAGSREVYCICVTADSFGVLASNLTLLLEKKDEDSYPWAVSLPDLETALDGFKQLGKTFYDFCRFLSERSTLHGKVFGSDELEFVGTFLRFGGFGQILEHKLDHNRLDTNMSDIFDELYMKKHGLGPGPVEGWTLSVRSPESDRVIMGEYLAELKSSLAKLGRNEPCPCGSGKKFKTCHMKLLQEI